MKKRQISSIIKNPHYCGFFKGIILIPGVEVLKG